MKNTSRKGWAECEFLDRAMKQTPGKQFCVNGDVIQDWKVFERDIAKNEKCLNIFVWRGVEGPTYRLKFSEDRVKYSSTDLALALRPGQIVIEEVERFQNEILSQNYLAVYIRSEFMLRDFSIHYLRECIQLILQVCFALLFDALNHPVGYKNYLCLFKKDDDLSCKVLLQIIFYRGQKHLLFAILSCIIRSNNST